MKTKKYTKEELEKIARRKIIDLVSERKIPYYYLNKEQMICNILAVQEGKKPPHVYKSPKQTAKQKKEASHNLTPRIRNFCFEYATYRGIKTHKEWGEVYGVRASRITQWLSWQEVKELIESFRLDVTQRLERKFSDNVEHVVDKLLEIVDSKGSKEVRRKAIVNFLGFAGIADTNAMKINMNQNSSSAAMANAKSTAEMTDEEIEEEIKQLKQITNE